MTIEGKAIFVLGPNSMQNEFLASSLEKETDLKCFAHSDLSRFKSKNLSEGMQYLLLYDCMGKDADHCIEECIPLIENNPGVSQLCFVNVKKGTGSEEALMARGVVRGFFYLGEPFEHIAKGVVAVLNGEYWVSRRVMSALINKIQQGEKESRTKPLSHREVDILAMVLKGASNEEIADKLCISKNTARNHLYKIFKKINVKSRFQAALWAAKYL
jgi:DNA-binding NarL/FixJ family response regulator